MTGNAHSKDVKVTENTSALQMNRTLNDDFRKTGKGGIISISMGIHMLGRSEVENIMKLLAGPAGDSSCDAEGEHDAGEIIASNRPIYWEINYYNKDLDDVSPSCVRAYLQVSGDAPLNSSF